MEEDERGEERIGRGEVRKAGKLGAQCVALRERRSGAQLVCSPY